MQRNLQLYPYFEALLIFYFWAPVFFLYFSERVSLEQVLQLQALYYLAVVLFEVPSGYFSDRLGRKITLLISSGSFVLSNLVFYFSSEFMSLAAGQILMAVGFAFYSGTNHSFHYESLKSLGRGEEFRDREAKIGSRTLVCAALASVIGGWAAVYSLKNAYALTALSSFFAFIVALGFKEPTDNSTDQAKENERGSFLRQLVDCANYLRNARLRWVFVFMVLFTVVVHVPTEFFQPYTKLLNVEVLQGGKYLTLYIGLILAMGSLIASFFAAKSSIIAEKIGTTNVFLLAIVLELLIAIAMGLLLHPVIFLLILFRRMPAALMQAPYVAEVSPMIQSKHRATFFSLNSLAGRLMYSLVLMALSAMVGSSNATDWVTLSKILLSCSVLGAIGLVALYSSKGRKMTSKQHAVKRF